MHTFHFEMLVGNEFVKIFKIYHWVVPSIIFFYEEEVARKFPLFGY